MAAARRPPRSDPQNSHDFLPNAMPRSPLSAALFERQTRPSSRKQCEGRPALEHVVDGLGQIVPAGELGALLAHIGFGDRRPAAGSSVCRTAIRWSALLPLMDALDSNRASMRRTISIAIGERGISFLPAALRRAFSSISAMAKNGRRAWTQHAASRIGPGLRSGQIELVVAVIGVGLQDAGYSPARCACGCSPLRSRE